jgi:RimJ/RimL family protein N-acetyltransferase
LNRSGWGKGFATEAARPILEYGFDTLGLNRIVADIHPANFQSMRVAEKIGMSFVKDGNHGADPCKCYAMTHSEVPGSALQNS